MHQADVMRERLIREFTEKYMGKLFYFCLKKTGNGIEADDLTQDIVLQIVAALNKGVIPEHFSAWVWQIARNRYSVWAKEKHRRNESVTGADIGDYADELEDGSADHLDEMIRSEQTALLRRELAFVRSDYRNIVVAYYIEDKSVREIASSLSLSKSTVEQRLHRARTVLKEGMEMARNFGKRSYDPEEVTFAASGNQPSGLPWSAVGRKIPKNILLQASNNPSTVEELSVELGVALPYMEEEVEELHSATLLEKQGDKYVTNFFIVDKDCRMEVYHTLRKTAKERSRLLRAFIEKKTEELRALGIAGESVDDNTLRWWLVPYLTDFLIEDTVKGLDGTYDPPKRANGETWGFVGYEITSLPENIGMNHCGCGNHTYDFWKYSYGEFSFSDSDELPESDLVVRLGEYFGKYFTKEPLSDFEKELAATLDYSRFAHLSEDGYLIPDVIAVTGENRERIRQIFREDALYEQLRENTDGAYRTLEELLRKYSHPVLHRSLGYYIRMELYAMRMMAVHDLLEDGFLRLPENTGESKIGWFFGIK